MQKVVEYTEVVKNSKYGYLEDYGDIFLPEYKNSKESVFAVQCSDYADDNTTFGRANWSNMLNGCWGMWSCGWDFHKPSQNLVNAFKTKDGLPMFDTFNNEILAHQATPIQGSTKPYYHCLEQLKLLAGKKNEEQTPQVVLHTDQGSVYSSQAFCQAHNHYNILRSMSKAGTPTDNPIIEALNGWMKGELCLDFGLEAAEDVPHLLDEYVYYFNNRRPAAALGYKSPVQYKTELGF